MTNRSFQVSISVDETTGSLQAAYFRVRKGTVAETVEVVEGRAFADYDAEGLLLGIEMLAPCLAEVLDRLDEPEARDFLRRATPAQMACA